MNGFDEARYDELQQQLDVTLDTLFTQALSIKNALQLSEVELKESIIDLMPYMDTPEGEALFHETTVCLYQCLRMLDYLGMALERGPMFLADTWLSSPVAEYLLGGVQ